MSLPRSLLSTAKAAAVTVVAARALRHGERMILSAKDRLDDALDRLEERLARRPK